MKVASLNVKSFFLKNIKKILLVVLLTLAIVVFLYFWQSFQRAYGRKGLFAVEQAEIALAQWREAEEGVQKESLRETLEEKMQALVGLKSSFQTQARLLYVEGSYAFWVKKDLEEALLKFSSISNSYYQYAPSLIYRACICEQNGDLDGALELYEKLAKVDEPFFKAQGLFYQAIILEQKGDKDKAKSLYTVVLTEYPQLLWAKLSKNRLVYQVVDL